MRIWSYETLPTEKLIAGIFNMPSTFQFLWEMPFFERGNTENFKAARNKLFVSNE